MWLVWPHDGWAEIESVPCSTMFGETHANVYYVHNCSRVQFTLKNLSYLPQLANHKHFC